MESSKRGPHLDRVDAARLGRKLHAVARVWSAQRNLQGIVHRPRLGICGVDVGGAAFTRQLKRSPICRRLRCCRTQEVVVWSLEHSVPDRYRCAVCSVASGWHDYSATRTTHLHSANSPRGDASIIQSRCRSLYDTDRRRQKSLT